MSESALLRAVRDRIRTHDDFEDRQVEVEPDERVPAHIGHIYVGVMTAGVEAGPTHNTNEGAIDKLFHVDVFIAIRSTHVPRDRERNLFVALSRSFETYAEAIEGKVDFKYAVNVAADAYILAESGSTDGFIEPLKFANAGPIRTAPPELFAGTTGAEPAALIRTLHFRGARRVWTRS